MRNIPQDPTARDPDRTGIEGAATAPDPRERLPTHVHRARDAGIGYGNSSGYADTLHFTDGHVDPMFRFRW